MKQYWTLLTFFACGCACESYAAPALIISFSDSLSSGPVITSEVLVIATSGNYVDSVRLTSDFLSNGRTAGLAYEREGTYNIQVHAPGYKRWVMRDVEVEGGICHVDPERVHARLQLARPPVAATPVITGTVSDAGGHGTGGQQLTAEILPLGCGVTPLAKDTLTVPASGRYTVSFPRAEYIALSCIRVITDAWRGLVGDENIVQRDSVQLIDTLTANLRYDWARATVNVHAPNTTLTNPRAFSFEISDGRTTRTVPGNALRNDPQAPAYWSVDYVDVASSGTLSVHVLFDSFLRRSEGTASFPLQPDALITASAIISNQDPTRNCMGCAGRAAFPIFNAGNLSGDSLYVVFSVRPASRFVIY